MIPPVFHMLRALIKTCLLKFRSKSTSDRHPPKRPKESYTLYCSESGDLWGCWEGWSCCCSDFFVCPNWEATAVILCWKSVGYGGEKKRTEI